MTTFLRIGRHTFQVRCERPVPTTNGLRFSGAMNMPGGRWDRVAVARQVSRDLHGYLEQDEIIALVSEEFPEANGFYRFDAEPNLRVDSPFKVTPFSFEFERIGTHDDLRWESRRIGSTMDNNYSIAASTPMNAPPVGSEGYEPRHSLSVLRPVAYAPDIRVFYDLPHRDFRFWSVAPEDYYSGAAEILRRPDALPTFGPLAGLSTNVAPATIEVTNGLVRFWSAPGGDEARLETWNGSAWVRQPLSFLVGGSPIGEFSRVAIAVNRPEKVVVRYERAETGSGVTRLEVSVVRGAPGLSVRLSRDVDSTLGITSGVASTVTTNRIRRNTADQDTRTLWVVRQSGTLTGSTGTFSKTSTRFIDAFLGAELNGAPAGSTAADLAAQWIAAQAEDIRAVRRI